MGHRIVSIFYLGLTRERAAAGQHEPGWQSFYRYFPWEDWRDSPPRILHASSCHGSRAGSRRRRGARRERRQGSMSPSTSTPGTRSWCCSATSCSTKPGLVAEAGRPRKPGADPCPASRCARPSPHPRHRHCAAARQDQIPAGRVRADAAGFTLGQLQRAVEALAGRPLHKQNFRRLVDQQDLVEETGGTDHRYRRPPGQAVPLPPRGGARTGRRRVQAAARQLLSTQRNSAHTGAPLTPLMLRRSILYTQYEYIGWPLTAMARSQPLYERVKSRDPAGRMAGLRARRRRDQPPEARAATPSSSRTTTRRRRSSTASPTSSATAWRSPARRRTSMPRSSCWPACTSWPRPRSSSIPHKTVLIPDLARRLFARGLDHRPRTCACCAQRYPGVPVVTYVNTSAAVKAESDICCTSGNAIAVVESLGVPSVIMLPDEYLAQNVAAETKVEIIAWKGHCEVHERFTAADIRAFARRASRHRRAGPSRMPARGPGRSRFRRLDRGDDRLCRRESGRAASC